MRCDRVDFPLGGVAYRHTHPGPGIRYLLHGGLEIETRGARPRLRARRRLVRERARSGRGARLGAPETAFVRVLRAARRVGGKADDPLRRPADDELPKLQRATIHCEHALAAPR